MALAIGGLAQLLLVGQGIDINVVLLVAGLLAGAWLVRRREASLDRLDRWLPPAALAFAALAAIRSSPSLIDFDLAATLALSGASVAAVMGVAVTRRSLSLVLLLATAFSIGALAGAIALTPGLGTVRGQLAGTRASAAGPFVRGLLIALPVVVLFALLFASADAVFARVLGDSLALRLDFGDLLLRLLVVAVVAWAIGGLLATGMEPRTEDQQRDVQAAGGSEAEATSPRLRIGAIEASIVIAAVDLVFMMFVVLQVPYLFGGQDTLALTGVTYSEYARRGFFELMGAAFLAGLMVMTLDALVARRARTFTAGAIALAVLAGVVLVSAAVRLGLYQQAYGWTELRFFVLAGIVWVGASLALGALLIARGATRWLPHAGTIVGLVVALAVNLADPQAFVASQNVDRALHPERIAPGGRSGLDAGYLATLGDDAVPTLVAALPSLPESDARLLEQALRRRLQRLESAAREEGWPSANLARARALEVLRATFRQGSAAPWPVDLPLGDTRP